MQKKNYYRKYKIREDFFLKINTEKKAYILGLICADGSIGKNLVEISLQAKDKEILEKISKILFINSRPLIRIKASTYKGKNGKIKKRNEAYRLSLCSKKICEDLYHLGIKKRKTLNLNFPTINDNFISHFIRGYYDGDGGLSLSRRGNSFVSWLGFIGTLDVCLKIKNYAYNHGINCSLIHAKTNPPEIYNLYISGSRQIISFLSLIYKNSSIYMRRKFNLYKKLKRLRSARYLYDLFTATSPEGKKYTRFNISAFAKKHGLHIGNTYACLNGKAKSCHKWTFKRILNRIPVIKTELLNAKKRYAPLLNDYAEKGKELTKEEARQELLKEFLK